MVNLFARVFCDHYFHQISYTYIYSIGQMNNNKKKNKQVHDLNLVYRTKPFIFD